MFIINIIRDCETCHIFNKCQDLSYIVPHGMVVFIKKVFKFINRIGIYNAAWKFVPSIYHSVGKKVREFGFVCVLFNNFKVMTS